jgi:acylphosphatase
MPDIRKIHKNITVIGRVQGVGFRFACRNMANSLGIKGYVRNLFDGNVYIEAEGTEVQLRHFIDWCSKGPSYANVSEITVIDDEIKGFQFFEITH